MDITTTALTNLTVNTTLPPFRRQGTSQWLSEGVTIFSCTLYGLVATLSILGNLMVVISFFINDKLRTVTNYLVVGLAAADILVGATSIPLWMNFIRNPIATTKIIQQVFTFFDMFSGIASILHLMAISMERYFCVGWAIKHRNAPKYIYYIVVAVVWLISALAASIPLMSIMSKTDMTLLVVVIFFLLPFVVIVISYAAIWKIALTRMGNNPTKRSLKREIRTASTIAFVIGFFFITWSPFFIFQSAFIFCGTACSFKGTNETLVFLKLLHYLNSAVNPVVYGVRIPEFRKTFKFILKKLYGPILSITRR